MRCWDCCGNAGGQSFYPSSPEKKSFLRGAGLMLGCLLGMAVWSYFWGIPAWMGTLNEVGPQGNARAGYMILWSYMMSFRTLHKASGYLDWEMGREIALPTLLFLKKALEYLCPSSTYPKINHYILTYIPRTFQTAFDAVSQVNLFSTLSL